jgi:hypothetical protein
MMEDGKGKTSNTHPPPRQTLWQTRHPTLNVQGKEGGEMLTTNGHE